VLFVWLDGQSHGRAVPRPLAACSLLGLSIRADLQRWPVKWIIETGPLPSGMPASHGILSNDEIMGDRSVLIRHLPLREAYWETLQVYSRVRRWTNDQK